MFTGQTPEQRVTQNKQNLQRMANHNENMKDFHQKHEFTASGSIRKRAIPASTFEFIIP